MTDIHDAFIAHRRAQWVTDWARGLVIYAERESLDILQPVDYDALETALAAFERAETAASEELDHFEAQGRIIAMGGRHAGRI